MPNRIDRALIWEEIEKNLFAVIGMTTSNEASRTSGIVYVVHERKFYIGVRATSWKAKHIARNASVSLTIPIHKSVPLMPWMKIPPATITLCGSASIAAPSDLDAEVLHKLFRGQESNSDVVDGTAIIIVEPEGEFVTYGVGVSLLDMRSAEKARGRAPVN